MATEERPPMSSYSVEYGARAALAVAGVRAARVEAEFDWPVRRRKHHNHHCPGNGYMTSFC